ncbi:MAG: hypothetical protein IID37_10340 [Planctomycetes bacterium]|nr:hypothetical protein [Planctomycetota bacterium]
MDSRTTPVDRLRAVMIWLGVGVVALIAGCPPRSTGLPTKLKRELDQAQLEKQTLARRNQDLEETIKAQERRIQDLMGFKPGTPDTLFAVVRIELATLTGGADFDGQPGDDGIVVYLRPLDADGHVIKAPGEITVKLVDNNGPGAPRLLGRVIDDPEELRRAWHGRFMTDHYTIKCPWYPNAPGKPQGPEVEIKVTFLDWRTGRSFTAHKVVEVSLPNPSKSR